MKVSGIDLNKHVGVENKCDLTSQKELPTDEAKELVDSLNLRRKIRVRRVKVPRRSTSR